MPMSPRLMRPLARRQAPAPSGTPASLLLRFDGNFIDSSTSALSFTSPAGSFNTTQKKFGTASYSVDQVDGPASTTQGVPDLSSGDWTIEAWVYRPAALMPNALAGIVFLSSAGDTASYAGGLNFYLDFNGILYQNNGYAEDASGGSIPSNQWSHVAAVRTSGVTTLYVDGVAVGTGGQPPIAGPYIACVAFLPTASGYLASNILVDDLRVVSGLAVYGGDFVPPTAALPANASAYTNYKPYGTLLFSECDGADLVGTYADGSGGRYTEVISEGACE